MFCEITTQTTSFQSLRALINQKETYRSFLIFPMLDIPLFRDKIADHLLFSKKFASCYVLKIVRTNRWIFYSTSISNITIKEIVLTGIVDLVAPRTNFQAWRIEFRRFLILDISRLFRDKIEDYLLFSKKFEAKSYEYIKYKG